MTAATTMADYLQLAATHYENFPVGSFVVPKARRVHVHRIYAFARTADDLADEARDAEALQAFRESFAAHLEDRADPPVPLLHDLVRSIREVPLPEHLFFDLLDAFALDLQVSHHDRASLLGYCRKSADPIGRLVLRVFEYDDPALDALSDRICTGLQILNHCQDVKEDWVLRGRVYLPREDLEAGGVTDDDLAAESATPALRAVVKHWTDDAATRFADGWALTEAVRGRLAIELRAILRGAGRVVHHIRAVDHDVLAHETRLRLGERLAAVVAAAVSRRKPKELT